MFMLRFLAVAALAASTLVPSISFAASSAPATKPPCILSEYHVTSVTPYRVDEAIGRGRVSRVRGAVVFVQAQPGLTGEWLQLKLQRHQQEMRTADMKDCAFDTNAVRVEVTSAGTGFAVKLIAKDSANSQEVLRRARLLVGA